jgi:hypothetical protein
VTFFVLGGKGNERNTGDNNNNYGDDDDAGKVTDLTFSFYIITDNQSIFPSTVPAIVIPGLPLEYGKNGIMISDT